jgi:hypothetical protein
MFLLEVFLVGTTELSEEPIIKTRGSVSKKRKTKDRKNSDFVELNLQTGKQEFVFHGLSKGRKIRTEQRKEKLCLLRQNTLQGNH